jgi:hypothetical protein
MGNTWDRDQGNDKEVWRITRRIYVDKERQTIEVDMTQKRSLILYHSVKRRTTYKCA